MIEKKWMEVYKSLFRAEELYFPTLYGEPDLDWILDKSYPCDVTYCLHHEKIKGVKEYDTEFAESKARVVSFHKDVKGFFRTRRLYKYILILDESTYNYFQSAYSTTYNTHIYPKVRSYRMTEKDYCFYIKAEFRGEYIIFDTQESKWQYQDSPLFYQYSDSSVAEIMRYHRDMYYRYHTNYNDHEAGTRVVIDNDRYDTR